MKTVFTLITIFLFLITHAQTQNKAGTLDRSFGTGGKVLDRNTPGEINKLALQSTGKIVACGEAYKSDTTYFQLMRYNKNGNRDSSFGENGLSAKVKYNVADLAIQPDDKIVTVGYTNVAVKISRYTKDGIPDINFGERGTITTNFSKHEIAAGVVIQPDGKILAGGYIRNNPNEPRQGFLVRYLTDGNLDKGFGNAGIVIFDAPDRNVAISTVTSIALANNGKIAVAVIYLNGSRGVVYRFKANGNLDSSFNGDGRAYFQSQDDSIRSYQVYDLAFQPDGKIVGCGSGQLENSLKTRMVISRLNVNGDIDATFGNNGITHVTYGSTTSPCNSILAQPDNKLIISGQTENLYQSSDFALARFNADGTPDSIFGEAGYQATTISKYDYEGSSVLQPDGRIILAGSSNSTQNFPSYVSLARYFGYNIKKKLGHYIDVNNAQTKTIASKAFIYPNPAKNILRIEGLRSNEKIKLTVVDFTGNVAISKQLKANSNSPYNLNIASLKQGNYLLKIETNDDVVTKQFVKE